MNVGACNGTEQSNQSRYRCFDFVLIPSHIQWNGMFETSDFMPNDKLSFSKLTKRAEREEVHYTQRSRRRMNEALINNLATIFISPVCGLHNYVVCQIESQIELQRNQTAVRQSSSVKSIWYFLRQN